MGSRAGKCTRGRGEEVEPETQPTVLKHFYNYNSRLGDSVVTECSETQSEHLHNERKTLTKADFALLRGIGKGAFGRVILVRKQGDGALLAMKILEKRRVVTQTQWDHTMAERMILQRVDHPFLATLRYAFQTASKLYLITDFFEGGELFFYLRREGRFSERQARFFVAEMTLALEYLHEEGICYRDLKPENCLLDAEGHIKLTDFGLSKMGLLRDKFTSTFCGTPEYLPPEVLLRRKYTCAIDWWSLGVLLFEMLEGRPPFLHPNRKRMFDLIIRARFTFHFCHSSEVVNLIQSLLRQDPGARICDAYSVKAHPWMGSDMNWEAVLDRQLVPPFRPPAAFGSDATTPPHGAPFVGSQPLETEVIKSPEADPHNQLYFAGFTYVPEPGGLLRHVVSSGAISVVTTATSDGCSEWSSGTERITSGATSTPTTPMTTPRS